MHIVLIIADASGIMWKTVNVSIKKIGILIDSDHYQST